MFFLHTAHFDVCDIYQRFLLVQNTNGIGQAQPCDGMSAIASELNGVNAKIECCFRGLSHAHNMHAILPTRQTETLANNPQDKAGIVFFHILNTC